MNKKQITMVTIALMLGNVMSGLDGTIINTAIPTIVAALHGIQFMGWIVAIFLLGMSISIPIWTKIGEKITNKKAFEISLVLFVLGAALQGMAPNIIFFLCSRFIMGIGAGGMGSLPYIIAGYVFKNIKTRTKVLGYLTASWNGAAILGPLVGGWLIDAFSWHWVFYINVPLGLISIILSFVFYRDVHKAKEKVHFDKMGAFTLIAGLSCFLVGIQMLGLASGIMVVAFVIIGIALLVAFIFVENKADSPVVPLSVFMNKALVGDFILFALAWGAYISVNTYLPMWSQAILGTSALIGGITLIPNSILDIAGSQRS